MFKSKNFNPNVSTCEDVDVDCLDFVYCKKF